MGVKSEAPPLTYRGLNLCDGCGIELAPGEQIAGLCPGCTQRHFPKKSRRSSKTKRNRGE